MCLRQRWLGRAVFCLALAGLMNGCSRSVAVQDAQEENGPLMRRARARAQSGDVDSAIRLYKVALESNERMARAHLDLALLLNDQKKDYVRAIYHYQRYLEVRPTAEKKEMIQDRIRLAGQQYAATIVRADRRGADKAALEKENADLKETVKNLKAEFLRLQQNVPARAEAPQAAAAGEEQAAATPVSDEGASPGAAATPVEEAPVKSAAAPAPVASSPGSGDTQASGRIRTYRVKRGDTLMRIAGEVYGDSSKWKKIQDANRKVLAGSSGVKVGQILVIP